MTIELTKQVEKTYSKKTAKIVPRAKAAFKKKNIEFLPQVPVGLRRVPQIIEVSCGC